MATEAFGPASSCRSSLASRESAGAPPFPHKVVRDLLRDRRSVSTVLAERSLSGKKWTGIGQIFGRTGLLTARAGDSPLGSPIRPDPPSAPWPPTARRAAWGRGLT